MKQVLLRLAAACALALPLMAAAIPEGPEPNTPAWFQREVYNYAKTIEAPEEEAANPQFLARLAQQTLLNIQSFTARTLNDPTWIGYPSLNLPISTPLCASWAGPCAGDPFRYASTDPFYQNDGEVTPFVIYDDGCARLSGRVWAPKNSKPGDKLPGVVIENGSIEAPETLYWWMAQALVRDGYVVLTFDPRGQGRSDQQTPSFGQGTNINPSVFWTGLVNVIDFFRSSPVMPYPHNQTCAGTYPTPVQGYNPYFDRIDPARLGIAGHSLGATGVSIVQGYGAAGADPWPGKLDSENPVKATVAWDCLSASAGSGSQPAAVPRVPAMGQCSEYGIGGTPFTSPPDPEEKKAAFSAWQKAGVPAYELTIQGSTHFEWSLIPAFPATSWCADTSQGVCQGGWGNPLAQHYSVAWFDRWLKQAGEPGYDDADARLLADQDWQPRYSFYYRSARSFPLRSGGNAQCEDIRAGCPADAVKSAALNASAPSRFGGALGALLLWPLLLAAAMRRLRVFI